MDWKIGQACRVTEHGRNGRVLSGTVDDTDPGRDVVLVWVPGWERMFGFRANGEGISADSGWRLLPGTGGDAATGGQ